MMTFFARSKSTGGSKDARQDEASPPVAQPTATAGTSSSSNKGKAPAADRNVKFSQSAKNLDPSHSSSKGISRQGSTSASASTGKLDRTDSKGSSGPSTGAGSRGMGSRQSSGHTPKVPLRSPTDKKIEEWMQNKKDPNKMTVDEMKHRSKEARELAEQLEKENAELEKKAPPLVQFIKDEQRLEDERVVAEAMLGKEKRRLKSLETDAKLLHDRVAIQGATTSLQRMEERVEALEEKERTEYAEYFDMKKGILDQEQIINQLAAQIRRKKGREPKARLPALFVPQYEPPMFRAWATEKELILQGLPSSILDTGNIRRNPSDSPSKHTPVAGSTPDKKEKGPLAKFGSTDGMNDKKPEWTKGSRVPASGSGAQSISADAVDENAGFSSIKSRFGETTEYDAAVPKPVSRDGSGKKQSKWEVKTQTLQKR